MLAGLLGVEHGYFATQQGNTTPSGFLISALGPPCQPSPAWHGCEPALTLITNVLVTVVSAVVVGLVVIAWSAFFVELRRGATTLPALTFLLFLGRTGARLLLQLHSAASHATHYPAHARSFAVDSSGRLRIRRSETT